MGGRPALDTCIFTFRVQDFGALSTQNAVEFQIIYKIVRRRMKEVVWGVAWIIESVAGLE